MYKNFNIICGHLSADMQHPTNIYKKAKSHSNTSAELSLQPLDSG